MSTLNNNSLTCVHMLKSRSGTPWTDSGQPFVLYNAQNKPISARTIYEGCGLAYATLRRNPEALLLYQQHSTFLKRERKRTKAPPPEAPSPRDPLLAYKKTQLVIQVREERRLRQEMEAQHAKLLEDYVQHDIKIAKLEVELAKSHGYLERLRISIQ